jgi:hypothetical protein
MPFDDDPSPDGDGADRRAAPVRSRRRLPAGLAETIDRCLSPDPGLRPAIGDLWLALGAPGATGAPRASRISRGPAP